MVTIRLYEARHLHWLHIQPTYVGMMKPRNSKPEPDRKYETKQRKCLKGREPFLSEWPGERICTNCKSMAFWRDTQAA